MSVKHSSYNYKGDPAVGDIIQAWCIPYGAWWRVTKVEPQFRTIHAQPSATSSSSIEEMNPHLHLELVCDKYFKPPKKKARTAVVFWSADCKRWDAARLNSLRTKLVTEIHSGYVFLISKL